MGEAALGSCEVTVSLATYLSFLEGLLGWRVASLQPCEGAVGRVVCLEHERGETLSRGETGLQSPHPQQQLREQGQGSGTLQKALCLQRATSKAQPLSPAFSISSAGGN